MEQQPHQGGEQRGHPTDEQLIHYGITEALREARPIDHATARAIASQLHSGQASPLYALVSSGALVEGLRDELDAWRTNNEAGVEVEPWLDALDEYIDSREESPDPIEGWSAMWPVMPDREDDEPETGDEERPPFGGSTGCAIGRTAVTAPVPAEQTEEDDAAVGQALFERISAAGVTTLGQVATVHASDQDDGFDDFPWTDAATWSPAEVARDDLEEARYTSDELDALFGITPDEEIGSVDELGWYGLIRHEDRPGGFFLRRDEQGLRRAGEAQTDEALEALWAMIQQEYATFHEQRDAYERATAEPSSAPSGHNPRIWVGSLSDYNLGQLYGAWMDATLEPDELQAAVQFLLRNSDTPGAEEWAIMDYEGFGEYEVQEYSSFTTVSRIAQGVARRGPAFAEWVSIVGEQSEELLSDEAFQDHYRGEWESLEDYVEDVLQETDFYGTLDEALKRMPEDLRRHVKLDLEGIAEEWEQGLHVIDAPGGKVWVFDT